MDFNVLDLVVYIGLCILLSLILPDDFKEEMGALIGLIIWVVMTIIYIILFVFIDYDIATMFSGAEATIKFSL